MPGTFDYNGVTFQSVTNKPPDEAWGNDNSRTTRYYKVPWAERHAAKNALLGTVEIKLSGGAPPVPYISRPMLPHPLTNMEAGDDYINGLRGDPWLYAISIPQCQGAGVKPSASGAPVWEWAMLTVNYEALPYEVKEDFQIVIGGFPDEAIVAIRDVDAGRFVSRKAVDATKFLETRGFAWKWANPDGTASSKSVSQAGPLILPAELITYTWHQVPRGAVNYAFIRSMYGLTNDDVFDGKEEETMVFLGYEEEPKRMAYGARTVNLQFKFRYMPKGANFLPDPERANEFYPVVSDDSLFMPHNRADYEPFFRIV